MQKKEPSVFLHCIFRWLDRHHHYSVDATNGLLLLFLRLQVALATSDQLFGNRFICAFAFLTKMFALHWDLLHRKHRNMHVPILIYSLRLFSFCEWSVYFFGRILLRCDSKTCEVCSVSVSEFHLIPCFFHLIFRFWILFLIVVVIMVDSWWTTATDAWENCFLTFYNWNVTATFCPVRLKRKPNRERERDPKKANIHMKIQQNTREKKKSPTTDTNSNVQCKWFRCKVTENEDKLHAMQCKVKEAMQLTIRNWSIRQTTITRQIKFQCTNGIFRRRYIGTV